MRNQTISTTAPATARASASAAVRTGREAVLGGARAGARAAARWRVRRLRVRAPRSPGSREPCPSHPEQLFPAMPLLEELTRRMLLLLREPLRQDGARRRQGKLKATEHQLVRARAPMALTLLVRPIVLHTGVL